MLSTPASSMNVSKRPSRARRLTHPFALMLMAAVLAVAERQQMVEEAAVSRYYLAELEFAQGHLGAALEALRGALAG